jgi:uncharacterized protein YegP (UPF0339 family)
MAAKFELYKDKAGEFRWRLRHSNGNIIADSGEGYKTKANAINGINSVKENVAKADTKEMAAKAAPKAKPAAAAMPKAVKYTPGMGEAEDSSSLTVTTVVIAAAAFFVIGGGIALVAMGAL